MVSMRRLQIDHVTEYQFPSPVTLLPHRLFLRPRESHNVRITSSRIGISPAHVLRWQHDALDNSIAIATFTQPASLLRIESQVFVEHFDDSPLDFLFEERARYHPFQYDNEETSNLMPFRNLVWPSDQLAVSQWLSTLGLATGTETFTLLDRLNRRICSDFRYQAREQPGVQSPAFTLAQKSGSCRDFAALFMDACRQLGFAARFVSGYHTSYESEGAGSTHAWAEVYLPGPGWKAFDPSAGLLAGSQHIAVAVASHPEAVAPVSGSYLGPAEPQPSMQVSVRVTESAP
jgi:transglutaminase-like putative cysteine protease